MTKIKDRKNRAKPNMHVWTEEQYEEYMKGLHGIEYIVGYTDGDVPYGLSSREESDLEPADKNRMDDSEDGIPF